MRVLLVGPGAVGRYVGAALMAAGHQVVFAARQRTAQSLVDNGIRLEGPRGNFHFQDVQVCTDVRTATGTFDIGISCVKLYDAQASAVAWRELLLRCQAVISLQNGTNGAELVACGAVLDNVFGGMAFVAAELQSSGVVTYKSDMSSITYGGPGATKHPALMALHQGLQDSSSAIQLASSLVEDVRTAQWSKLVGLATNAALTCLVRKPAGIVYHDEDLLVLAKQSIHEVASVGRAVGALIPEDHEERILQMLQSFPASMFASMHHDLAAGRPLELDGLIGPVVQLGRKHGVPTPFHSFAYACLKPHINGNLNPSSGVGV